MSDPINDGQKTYPTPASWQEVGEILNEAQERIQAEETLFERIQAEVGYKLPKGQTLDIYKAVLRLIAKPKPGRKTAEAEIDPSNTKSPTTESPMNQTRTLIVTIEGTLEQAEHIREEVVGAVEDAWERERIQASVGDLEPDEP